MLLWKSSYDTKKKTFPFIIGIRRLTYQERNKHDSYTKNIYRIFSFFKKKIFKNVY